VGAARAARTQHAVVLRASEGSSGSS
jgi:hypothetical protein